MFGQNGRRRLFLAFAVSLALHEIAAAFIHPPAPSEVQTKETVQHVTIARVERHALPTPTPTPTPSPTPKPVVTRAPIVRHPAPVKVVIPKPEGKSARKETIKHLGAARPKPPHIVHAKPIWDIAVPTGGQGAGAGVTAGAGSVGNGGNGTGAGNQGTGAGGGGTPCGAVDFIAHGEAHYNPDSRFFERDNIMAIVHFEDGSSQTIPLDWTWRFKTEDVDPFHNTDAPAFFQFPPASQRANEPPLVQYIMKYSLMKGSTTLRGDCPNIPPPSPVPVPSSGSVHSNLPKA